MADPSYFVDGVLTDGEAWIPLASENRASSTTTITFTNPSDGSSLDWSQFMDMVIVVYARSTHTGSTVPRDCKLTLNNDTSANYGYQWMYATPSGYGASALAANATGAVYINCGWIPTADATANYFGSAVTWLHDVNSGKYKSGVAQIACDQSGTNNYLAFNYVIWRSQAALTEMDFTLSGGDFDTGSRIDLFGVLPRMVA